MNEALLKVLALLGICMVMFSVNRPRVDVVALLVIAALPLTGVITVQQALAGFSDPNVVLIALLFVIGEALVRTGVTHELGSWLIRQAGNSEKRLLVLLMLVVAGLGSVMSSTGVVGVFIPVVMSVTRRMKLDPARFMMPLSVAGLLSGMMTLVATPPNMVMDSALRQEKLEGFTFFSFTPLGILFLVVGIGYMLLTRNWLKGGQGTKTKSLPLRRGFRQFIEDYQLHRRGFRQRLEPQSPMVGSRLDALNLRKTHGANIIAIERPGRFGPELIHPTASLQLRAGDILLIDFFHEGDVEHFSRDMGTELLPMNGRYFTESSHEVGMTEVVIPPESTLIGKSVLGHGFRRRYGLNVIGLRRQRKAFEGSFLEEKWQMGDILLVAGPWKAIRALQASGSDFVVMSLPPESEDVAPARHRMPQALAVLGLMIVLMAGGFVPNVIAALIACLLMGWLRCVDMASAYRSIHWQSLILIAGMIPFAQALESTGGIKLAVDQLMVVMHGAEPRLLLASLFLVTAVTGLFISNTATAVLMAPIAISIARHLDASALPFAMTVAIAASAAFMTPVSSPVNTLVMGPGKYQFMDFVKIGVPFTLIILVLTVILVPWLFPF